MLLSSQSWGAALTFIPEDHALVLGCRYVLSLPMCMMQATAYNVSGNQLSVGAEAHILILAYLAYQV